MQKVPIKMMEKERESFSDISDYRKSSDNIFTKRVVNVIKVVSRIDLTIFIRRKAQ